MTLAVTAISPDELGPDWDACLKQWSGATLFSHSIFLRRLGGIRVLIVSEGADRLAAFPVPVLVQDGVAMIARASYLSPYFPVLFRPDNGPPTRAERRRRAILDALLGHIRQEYAAMVLPLHPDLTDMAPFQRAHVQLELRSTYLLPLASLDSLWHGFDSSIRNHIRKAEQVSIEENRSLAAFDFDAATFYEDQPARDQWRMLARELAEAGLATALIARDRDRVVGGLLLCHDAHTGYNLLSYFDRESDVRGVPSALVWAAAKVAAAKGLAHLDLEGSVLTNIEDFYQQFGGTRRPYFGVHWYADERRQTPVLYRYQDEAGACS